MHRRFKNCMGTKIVHSESHLSTDRLGYCKLLRTWIVQGKIAKNGEMKKFQKARLVFLGMELV